MFGFRVDCLGFRYLIFVYHYFCLWPRLVSAGCIGLDVARRVGVYLNIHGTW